MNFYQSIGDKKNSQTLSERGAHFGCQLQHTLTHIHTHKQSEQQIEKKLLNSRETGKNI